MQETTSQDRENELRSLLDQMSAHPERDWSTERKRVAVLQAMLSSSEAAND